MAGILPHGEKAIVHVENNRPDIILLDINLKGKMDGIETAAIFQQKKNRLFSSLPILTMLRLTGLNRHNQPLL
ncbi:response regulator [Spirosoma validum]|uniref:hypothetical protein n=1 Tax=Spirosoma validum TaxID=2771355 RepID=UPI00293BBB52|nr:hypothetical protein [Spirosoma validum]